MIERHIAFTVDAARREAFERFFIERYQPAAAASPGYVGLALVRSADDPSQYQVTFRWQAVESATGWRTSSVHAGLQPDLTSLSVMGDVRVYDVVI